MGAGGFAPSLGYFCAYIGGRRGISALFILPTQKPWFPHVVSLDFFFFFDINTAKIETELSPTFTSIASVKMHATKELL